MAGTDELTTDRPTGDDPVGDEPGSAERAPARSRLRAALSKGLRPAHVAGAVVLAGAGYIATTPIDDLDSYWHVEIGREIVARRSLDGLGLAWVGVPVEPWHTSQWLSEVGMYALVEGFGWGALPVTRLLVAAALFTLLTLTLVRRRQPIAAFLVLLTTVVGLEVLLQDRPATLSLLFLALLGPACERLWTTGRRPPLLAVAAACVLWAQLHGLWVLAPAAFGLVAVGALLDRRRAAPGQFRSALICTAAACAGVLNPQGVTSFLLPLRFRSAGHSRITEWFPTTFLNSLSVAWGVLVLLLIFAWVRSKVRVSSTELLWCTAWTVFALTAIRNVGPAILLMAPVTLRALERSFGPQLERVSARPSPVVGRILAGTALVTIVGGVVVCAAATLRLDPLENTPALDMARRLRDAPGPIRIYNDYNASGSLVAFAGGGEGHVKLVVDGRSDLWGGPHIERHAVVQNVGPGWETDVFGFRPDAVLMAEGAPLVQMLRETRQWTVAMTDGGYVLLTPPGSRLLR